MAWFLLERVTLTLSVSQTTPGRHKHKVAHVYHGREGIRHASTRSGFTGAIATRELIAFRSSTRNHPIMNNVAEKLTDQDIQEIALWLDSIE